MSLKKTFSTTLPKPEFFKNVVSTRWGFPRPVKRLLDLKHGNSMKWPPRFPDLTSLDYFLKARLKEYLYRESTNLIKKLQDIIRNGRKIKIFKFSKIYLHYLKNSKIFT